MNLVHLEKRKIVIQMIKLVKRQVLLMATINQVHYFLTTED